MQLPGTPDADQLLQALPLAHLQVLHFTGPWALSARAAAALTAATALQALTLPGAGLQEALAALSLTPRRLCSVLSGRLQYVRLSDAGGCSAATLRALSDQLTALAELRLDYNPLPNADSTAAGMSCTFSSSSISPGVHTCWADLPALRSLQIGPAGKAWLRLQGDSVLLDSIAGLTRLTSLTLGPSAQLRAGSGGLRSLPGLLQGLTGLRQLALTLQVNTVRY